VKETTLQTPRSEEGERGGAPGAGAEIPLQPLVKTIVRQAVPMQPMEVHGGAPPAACGGPHAGAGGCALKEVVTLCWKQAPGRNCSPVESSPQWSRFSSKTYSPCKGPTLEQSVPEGLHPMERNHARGVLQELQPMGRTAIGEDHERTVTHG